MKRIQRELEIDPTLPMLDAVHAAEAMLHWDFTQLDAAPFRGPVGEWIRDNISAETWREWIGQGTKVINELRLDLSKDEDAATYDRYMHEFLGVTDDVLASTKS